MHVSVMQSTTDNLNVFATNNQINKDQENGDKLEIKGYMELLGQKSVGKIFC